MQAGAINDLPRLNGTASGLDYRFGRTLLNTLHGAALQNLPACGFDQLGVPLRDERIVHDARSGNVKGRDAGAMRLELPQFLRADLPDAGHAVRGSPS